MDNKAQGSQLLLLMLMMFLLFFVFGNPEISAWIALSLNSIFYPLIGFGGSMPVLTIVLAGIFVVFLSSFFNNLFADWKKMGEMQEVTRAFQKELGAARKTGNTNRVNKLMKMQPQIMKKQTEAQSGMMKPMVFLFIFIVPIFMWLRYFLAGLSYYYFTVPWASGVLLFDRPFLMQAWLWIYMIFSFVIGQLFRQAFKWISWSDWWAQRKGKFVPLGK
jgi:uncharacterized membrane protein (DUF106 family)